MRYQKKKSVRSRLIAILSCLILVMVGFSAVTSLTSKDSKENTASDSAKAEASVTQEVSRAVSQPVNENILTSDTDYWEVLLGGKKVALLDNELSAKDMIKYIMDQYAEEGAISVTLEPEMTIEKKTFSKGEEKPEVTENEIEIAKDLLQGTIKETSYEVQEGDTIWDIAIEKETDVETILNTNPEIDPEVLVEGDTISFFEGEPEVNVRVETQETLEESISYDVIYEETDELYEGEEEVVVEGSKGSKTLTVNSVKVNGVLESQETVEEVVNQEPVAMVVRVGTMENPEESEEGTDEFGEEYEEGSEDSYSEEDSESYSEEGSESYSEEASDESYDDSDDSADDSGESLDSSSDDNSGGTSSKKQAIVDAAMAQLGIDQSCTTLVSKSLEAAGISCWTGPSGFTSLGDWTDNPEPGDICIYTSHVAIYIGDGMAVHGGWVGDGPRTTAVWTVSVSWPQFLGYIHLDI